ncbi:Hypothetical_protein [Hexamita inflata]|uniref:Hypothetical_protein n=1 Tax=Hexamita inflata TaxID=28002 RepID=A0AA86NGB0_9EUKA|nr:Hypothetical protein HINF_LOCUS7017 [Hexamita inflata]
MNCVQRLILTRNLQNLQFTIQQKQQLYYASVIYSIPERILNANSDCEFICICQLLFDNAISKYFDYSEYQIIERVLVEIDARSQYLFGESRFVRLVDTILFYFAKQSQNNLFNSCVSDHILNILQNFNSIASFSSSYEQFLLNFVECEESATKVLTYLSNVSITSILQIKTLCKCCKYLRSSSQLVEILQRVQFSVTNESFTNYYFMSAAYLGIFDINNFNLLNSAQQIIILKQILPLLDVQHKYELQDQIQSLYQQITEFE